MCVAFPIPWTLSAINLKPLFFLAFLHTGYHSFHIVPGLVISGKNTLALWPLVVKLVGGANGRFYTKSC